MGCKYQKDLCNYCPKTDHGLREPDKGPSLDDCPEDLCDVAESYKKEASMDVCDMTSGCRYRFVDLNGTIREGAYELDSGNFFVGEGESYSDHTLFFEVAACEGIEEI